MIRCCFRVISGATIIFVALHLYNSPVAEDRAMGAALFIAWLINHATQKRRHEDNQARG